GDAHRPLRVVAVAAVGAEDRDHRVADELLDAAPAPLDLVLDARVERTLERANLRRVGAVRARRETDQVGEEHRDEATLVHPGHCLRGRAVTASRRARAPSRAAAARAGGACGGDTTRARARPSGAP